MSMPDVYVKCHPIQTLFSGIKDTQTYTPTAASAWTTEVVNKYDHSNRRHMFA